MKFKPKHIKSGQMVGQIFIYIVALIVMALIFVYGYNAVSSILKRGEQVLFIQMKTEIESAVDDVSSDFGRVDKKTLSIPGKYNRVCFVDLEKDAPSSQPPTLELPPIVYDSWQSKAEKNMFLIYGSSINPLYIGDIQIGDATDPGYLCINAPYGKITIWLEGVEGGRVKLSEALN